MSETERLLSHEEVAERLSVSAVTARARLRRGNMPGVEGGDRRPSSMHESTPCPCPLVSRSLSTARS